MSPHENQSEDTTPKIPPPGCPAHQTPPGCSSSSATSVPSEILPDSQRAPGQKTDLNTVGVRSSIPKGDGGKWMYPSEQRFYNALLKKGWNPEENLISTVVSIHNTVNERCWREILQYESFHPECQEFRKLVNFKGRPNEYSPKARLAHLGGRVLPFDRHDWVVDRCGKQITYIIDFYEGKSIPQLPPKPVEPSQQQPKERFQQPKQQTSEPGVCPVSPQAPPAASVYLDVRPQLTLSGLYDRIRFQYHYYFSNPQKPIQETKKP